MKQRRRQQSRTDFLNKQRFFNCSQKRSEHPLQNGCGGIILDKVTEPATLLKYDSDKVVFFETFSFFEADNLLFRRTSSSDILGNIALISKVRFSLSIGVNWRLYYYTRYFRTGDFAQGIIIFLKIFFTKHLLVAVFDGMLL